MDRTVREVLGVRGKRVARIDHLVAELAEPGAPSFHDLLAFGFGGRSAPSCVDENEIRHFLRSFCEWCPDLRAPSNDEQAPGFSTLTWRQAGGRARPGGKPRMGKPADFARKMRSAKRKKEEYSRGGPELFPLQIGHWRI